MVLASRILLGGLLGGRGIAIVYSAAGGAACFAGMLLLKRAIDVYKRQVYHRRVTNRRFRVGLRPFCDLWAVADKSCQISTP